MNATPKKLRQCKAIAWIGIAVMGAGSFLACLPASHSLMLAGSVVLVAGIAISAYGFAYWRP